MAIKKLFVQQLIFDGLQYTKGTVVDVLAQWNIGVTEFPFVRYPESKDVATRDWKGIDGIESYIPTSGLPVKDYDIEVDFLYSGTKERIRNDLTGFIDFLYGRGTVSNIGSGRLAVYDEHVEDGKKDIHVVTVNNELYWNEDCDDETIATFKIKFHIDDPTTDVYPVIQSGVVTDLAW